MYRKIVKNILHEPIKEGSRQYYAHVIYARYVDVSRALSFIFCVACLSSSSKHTPNLHSRRDST